jgi:pimeloyl-ACP methyl ester carboxylesterase
VAKLTSEISGAERELISGAGHLVPMEKPDVFDRIAIQFLAKVYPK